MASMTRFVGGLLLVLFCFLTIGEQAVVLQRRELSKAGGAHITFEWADHQYPASPRDKRAKRTEECRDMDGGCYSWAMTGECEVNPNYMLEQCAPSCGVCTRVACEDKDDDCVERAARGECDSNQAQMRSSCRLSCHVCTPDSTELLLSKVRPGKPTKSNSCNRVRGVPEELRDPANMHPDGLDRFYQKYTEAYGIPIVASADVSDDALKRFCYVVRVLLAEHSGVRENVYKRSGRMGIVGIHETTTTIPEHSHLDSSYWDYRTRAIGATITAPISTTGEENLLCSKDDTRWLIHDISLHEFSHAAHIIGMNFAEPSWGRRLNEHYLDAKKSGLWGTSYAAETVAEFFAVGVVAYYNSYRTLPTETCMTGNSGPIVTRERLREFDPVLYGLIREIYPCDNAYINRCETSRAEEMRQEVRFDCENSPVPDRYVGDQSEAAYTPEHVDSICGSECADNTDNCPGWAARGECAANPNYMLEQCKLSCLVCKREGCFDNNDNCPGWASSGECSANPGYMLKQCELSCSVCQGEGTPPPTTGEGCADNNNDCPGWASRGECSANPGYMLKQCKRSCLVCSA